jgi:hypothetical protein
LIIWSFPILCTKSFWHRNFKLQAKHQMNSALLLRKFIAVLWQVEHCISALYIPWYLFWWLRYRSKSHIFFVTFKQHVYFVFIVSSWYVRLDIRQFHGAVSFLTS